MAKSKLFAEAALLPSGWAKDVLFSIDDEGNISKVSPGSEPQGAELAKGPVLPGMPNLHSHAFQRAMAGLGERAGPKGDSFWTWREVMYSFVNRLSPDQVQAIATQLYIEMLKAGYTAVAEFHYLHHQPDGTPFDDRAEMSKRILAAADSSGIGITLLPVLYSQGGFDGQPPSEEQRRFVNKRRGYVEILEALVPICRGSQQRCLGIAPHSLRAVTPKGLARAIEAIDEIDPSAPIHLHIAEQKKEVHDCINWCGQRPIRWLRDNFDVGRRWCLIHATHISESGARRLAGSGAVVGLCPTTEANLGDGVFPATEYIKKGGAFGIGSDSNTSLSPIEELRWLEYGQRLWHQQRNILAGKNEGDSVGSFLYSGALAGGAQALGRPIGRLESGCRADLVVLDPDRASLTGRKNDHLLDALIFAGNENPVRDVMVGGKWRVQEGRHAVEEAALSAYRATMSELLDG